MITTRHLIRNQWDRFILQHRTPEQISQAELEHLKFVYYSAVKDTLLMITDSNNSPEPKMAMIAELAEYIKELENG